MSITSAGFLAYARTRTGEYDYHSVTDCAFAQYLQHLHPGAAVIVGGFTYDVDRDRMLPIPSAIVNSVFAGGDTTWEALAARLERRLA